jgi:hypothetical protein
MNSQEHEIYFDELKFQFEGKEYNCVGVAFHRCYRERVGIGSYEFWGMRGSDKRSSWESEGHEMWIDGLEIYDGDTLVKKPSKGMIEIAENVVFDKTHVTAEQRCY